MLIISIIQLILFLFGFAFKEATRNTHNDTGSNDQEDSTEQQHDVEVNKSTRRELVAIGLAGSI